MLFYITFSSLKIPESDQEKPGIILDYSEVGQIVGIEILNASAKMEHKKRDTLRSCLINRHLTYFIPFNHQ